MLRYPTESICISIGTSRGIVSVANLYSVRSCLLRIFCTKAVRGWCRARAVASGASGVSCVPSTAAAACKLYSSQAPRFAKFAKFQFRPKLAYACRGQIEQHIGFKSHLLATGKERKRLDDRRSEPPAPQPRACSTIDSTDMPFVISEEDFGRPAKNTAFYTR